MSWGAAAAEGAGSAGSTAGAAGTAGSAAGSAGTAMGAAEGVGSAGSAGSGVLQSGAGAFEAPAGAGVLQANAGAAPISGGQMWGSTPTAAEGAPWYSRLASAVKDYSNDYNAGEKGDLATGIDSAIDGKYMKLAGYLGGKMPSNMGVAPPANLIQLPNSPTPDNPMGSYAQIYQMFKRR